MAANEHRDTQAPRNHHWTINADGDGTSSLEVWWSREKLKKAKRGKVNQEENLVVRQENDDESADVIMLTFGQAYDLIDAMNRAVERA